MNAGVGGDIVVGVDGTPASIGALRWAAVAAIRRGRPLRLVHCVGWPAYAAASGLLPPDQDDDHVRGPAEALIRRMAAQAHEWAPNVAVHGVVLRGGPAAILRDESRAADLVVVGSR